MLNDENIYRINLKNALTASDLVYGLSMSLEKEEVKNKKIFLQMNDIDLSVAQLKSIRSLINSINSSLSFISTNSEMTKASAMALEIVISNEDTNLSAKLEPEKTYKTVEEVLEEKNETAEETQKVISIETDDFTHEDAQNALESILEEPNSQEKASPKEETILQEDISEEKTNATEENAPETTAETENSSEGEENNNTDKNNENEDINPLDSIFEGEKKLEEMMNFAITEEGTAPNIEYYKNLDNEFTDEDLEIDGLPTMYVKHTLRSGQVINYEGNVVIIGDCHTGSEVQATGDITVWGVLSGIAHAGSMGNTRAKIRALKMNAIQLRIADSYARKPDALNSVLVEKTNVFTPEEARNIDGDIIIFKIND